MNIPSYHKPPERSDNDGSITQSPDNRPKKPKKQGSPVPKMKEKDEEMAEILLRESQYAKFPSVTGETAPAAPAEGSKEQAKTMFQIQLFLRMDLTQTPTKAWHRLTGHHTPATMPQIYDKTDPKSDASSLRRDLLMGIDLIQKL